MSGELNMSHQGIKEGAVWLQDTGAGHCGHGNKETTHMNIIINPTNVNDYYFFLYTISHHYKL